jgi:hypothetical protein
MTPYEQANDPATPAATLDRLAGNARWEVRFAVARNPATPPATLDLLASDVDWWVRHAVARHSATLPATLDRLAGDDDGDVRWAVAGNPATPRNTQLAYCGTYALVLSRNGGYYAGCRGPMTLAEARAHWGPPRNDPRAVLFHAALDKHANL